VTPRWRGALFLLLLACASPFAAFGQIDPYRRELMQFGYNVAFQGHPPLSGYAFYYLNQPDFLKTNLTLRLAVAPTYLDSELGFRQLLSPTTDLGLGLAGGGFADSYAEIRKGTFLPEESFTGHGGELAVSLYQRFNPDQEIPLNGMVRGIAHYSTYIRDSDTAGNFQLPPDHGTFLVRTGLRWGGHEPIIFPSLAMELSVWYEGQFRSESATYGFSGDRRLNPDSHLFWAEALLAYTLPKLQHTFYLSLTAGTSLDPDRFSTYRLGALLPLVSEFPLSLPGYFYQEISAQHFVLLGGNYLVPLDSHQRWNLNVMAATAAVDYLEGLEQPGHWHSGVGFGVLYKTPSFKVMIGYAYGIDAIRDETQGAHSVGILMQIDLVKAKAALFDPSQPSRWRGLQQILGGFGQ
jgi:hypothetical protein